jgi:phage terminase large subunit-like protein
MRYCEEDELDNITDELEDIKSECDNIEDEGVATNIKAYCREIENIVDSFREVDDADEDLKDMIPDNLSAGAAISLKETLNKWRSENGYHEL